MKNTFTEQKFLASDNYSLHLYQWHPKELPVGVVQIIHGSCEHMMRYDRFANFLTSHNYLVIGADLRGHGKTVTDNKTIFGYFAKKNGWNRLEMDIKDINNYIKINYPNLPIYLFGHSMGSFLARTYISHYLDSVNKVIISGTSNYSKSFLKIMRLIANYRVWTNGPMKEDKKLYNLSFKPLNKKFCHEANHMLTWLAKDPSIAKNYLADKMVFKYFTSLGYYDLACGLEEMVSKQTYQKTPINLPLFFISGKNDPVGKFGYQVIKTSQKYQKIGCGATVKLYDQMRHEILNDYCFQDVYNDILSFIKK